MEESQKTLCKVKEADTKDNIVFYYVYIKCPEEPNQNKMNVDCWLPDAEGWMWGVITNIRKGTFTENVLKLSCDDCTSLYI